MDMLLGLDMLKRHQVRYLSLQIHAHELPHNDILWKSRSLKISLCVNGCSLYILLLQCSIDLKKNTLLIGTTGTETRFLPEAELPECARLAYGPEGPEDTQPDEIADRELAEALQRSVQESGKEHGLGERAMGIPQLFVCILKQWTFWT
jgi:hypothetical protein